ncbi:MAG: FHA domain-containing protein [Nocardioidaceae bacterium]|nr:FHA domain-containing protein [Nocardioidaceae bacterium]MCL2612627.1 FHA domain-containing protein [Nocardioidaceae bacterium]
MSVCPAGHQSAADDYCDVCGLPIGAAPAAADRPVEAVDPPGVPLDGGAKPVEPVETADATCPNCQAVNPPNALFCEACGYDFTTGSMPRPADPADPAAPAEGAEQPKAVEPVETAAPVAPPIGAGWVAEVWIDPDWYAAQESADPLPSAGLPTVVALRTQSLLVGRASRTRGISPDIDLSSDTGISRRHCQLTTDGRRWWVEDLGSSNGTYVGDAVGPLPTAPLVAGQKRELDADDRIYLGAWTRIVIRRAEPGEA